MLKFRLYLTPPNADKPLQSFHVTRKQAEDFLKLLLDAGQPKGTRWAIWESKEELLTTGEC